MDNLLYITLYTSKEKLDSFTDGFSDVLTLMDIERKSPLDTIQLSVPLKYLYREDEDFYYINRRDFADQF